MEIHNRSSTVTKESRKTVHDVIVMVVAAVVNAVASVEAAEADLRVQVMADLPAVVIADRAPVVGVKADLRARDSAMIGVIAAVLAETEITGRVLKILRWFRGSSF
ncbi:MAG: hypothetical protein K8R87_01560 [Verrucomicrobia bacterium]|nr:hypothetical protein [Verrucomicrobiota bacterium]